MKKRARVPFEWLAILIDLETGNEKTLAIEGKITIVEAHDISRSVRPNNNGLMAWNAAINALRGIRLEPLAGVNLVIDEATFSHEHSSIRFRLETMRNPEAVTHEFVEAFAADIAPGRLPKEVIVYLPPPE